jgi:hypothetical protein
MRVANKYPKSGHVWKPTKIDHGLLIATRLFDAGPKKRFDPQLYCISKDVLVVILFQH